MNRFQLISILGFVVSLFAIGLLWAKLDSSVSEIESTIAEFGPTESPNAKLSSAQMLDFKIRDAKSKLADSALRISRIKARVPDLSNIDSVKRTAKLSLEEAERRLDEIRKQGVALGEENSKILLQLTNLQSGYESKIAKLESKIEEGVGSGFNIEFLVALIGIMTSISAMILSWKKESRDSEKATADKKGKSGIILPH